MSSDSFEVLAPSETTTLVRGATVAVSSRSGEIRSNALLGVMYRDERLLSSVTVLVDGGTPPLLASDRTGASSDRIASLAALDQYRNGQALLVRRRTVTDGIVREDIELHSFGPTKTVELTVVVESDAASILGLKSGRSPRTSLPWSVTDTSEATSFRRDAPFATVVADGDAAMVIDGPTLHLSWKAETSTERVWTTSWSVRAAAGDHDHDEVASDPVSSFVVEGTDGRWSRAMASAIADLTALAITLPDAGMRFVGAGAPWYQALFGRDSLITAWESLPLGTELALDTLDALAKKQGTEHVRHTRQAPGKILHELRIGNPQVFGMEVGEAYYGSVDASPLFVMLLAEAYRWGAPVERIRRLLPAARQAMAWCQGDAVMIGDENRGPFVWYTPDPKGLGNQGWKDSGDCMVRVDGTLAEGSLAVAEAQSYVHEALVGLARLERDLGDGEHAAVALERAAMALSQAFVEHFWLPDEGLIALAIDEAGVPLRVATSNMGQCLWSGILPDDIAAKVAERVMASDLRTPWGIRTLGANERAYNPLGYHLGAVWAHDSAIVAAGLVRHGHHEAFRTLTNSLLDAAERFDWRLPELYGGLDTGIDGAPLPYPAACSPQAWSAGVPLLLLRGALGLQPDVPAGVIHVAPSIRSGDRLRVSGLRLGDESGEISVDHDGVVHTAGFSLRVSTPKYLRVSSQQ
jgi:glycogen debranching enzyme